MADFIKIAQIFFIGAFAGWVMELFFRRFAHKKWINPGFLVGPWLPLYGLGLTGLFAFSEIDLSFISNVVLQKVFLILIITVVMTLLEYFTGLIFIKGLKVKLWDYSDRKGNIQGIICPLFSAIWGIIGALYNLFLHQYILTALNYLSGKIGYIFLVGVFAGIFIIDNIYSFKVVAKIKSWAKEHDVVVRYEHFKLNVKQNAEKLKQKSSFMYSLKGPGEVVYELNRYLLEQGKKLIDGKIKNKKSKTAEAFTDEGDTLVSDEK